MTDLGNTTLSLLAVLISKVDLTASLLANVFQVVRFTNTRVIVAPVLFAIWSVILSKSSNGLPLESDQAALEMPILSAGIS